MDTTHKRTIRRNHFLLVNKHSYFIPNKAALTHSASETSIRLSFYYTLPFRSMLFLVVQARLSGQTR